jgi:hypothetical protein
VEPKAENELDQNNKTQAINIRQTSTDKTEHSQTTKIASNSPFFPVFLCLSCRLLPRRVLAKECLVSYKMRS